MKLIVAIVQDEDAGRLVSALMDKGFGVTKLATTGGFLRAGNTTLISGVEDEKLDAALAVIEKNLQEPRADYRLDNPMGGAGGDVCAVSDSRDGRRRDGVRAGGQPVPQGVI